MIHEVKKIAQLRLQRYSAVTEIRSQVLPLLAVSLDVLLRELAFFLFFSFK